MSLWLNTKKIMKKNITKDKPCYVLGYCPYGEIVEEFSLDDLEINNIKINCRTFGHHCPMFYNAEDIIEDEE